MEKEKDGEATSCCPWSLVIHSTDLFRYNSKLIKTNYWWLNILCPNAIVTVIAQDKPTTELKKRQLNSNSCWTVITTSIKIPVKEKYLSVNVWRYRVEWLKYWKRKIRKRNTAIKQQLLSNRHNNRVIKLSVHCTKVQSKGKISEIIVAVVVPQ